MRDWVSSPPKDVYGLSVEGVCVHYQLVTCGGERAGSIGSYSGRIKI